MRKTSRSTSASSPTEERTGLGAGSSAGFHRLSGAGSLSILLGLAAWLTAAVVARAGATVVEDVRQAHQDNQGWADQLDAEARSRYGNDTNVLLRAGLIADRRSRTVTFLADGTGMKENDPVEFFLVADNSAHAYEAVAVSFARPGDIRAGLEFIGMTAGRPVDFKKLWVWPKGERVRASVSLVATGEEPVVTFPLEHLVRRVKTGKLIETNGFVFVGSTYGDDPDAPGRKVLLADRQDPRSILSDYNEPQTVLDVPYRAAQGEVYNDNTVNPLRCLAMGRRIRVTLTPEFTNGQVRVRDLVVRARPRGAAAVRLADVAFEEYDAQAGQTNRYPQIDALLAAFNDRVGRQQDPFVTMDFSGALSLGVCHDLAAILARIDSERGIRMEPPPDGQFYFRAYVPDEQQRDYTRRYAQPLELHLKGTNRVESATVRRIEEVWADNAENPELKVQQFPVAEPGGMRAAVKASADDSTALFVYAHPDLPMQAVADLATEVRDTHPLVHIYLDQPAPDPVEIPIPGPDTGP